MDKFAISDFIFKLSSESWEDVFDSNDVTLMFNKFLNTHLNIFHSSFPIVRSTTKNYVNNRITPGIKTAWKRKRELFLLTKTSNDSAMKRHYKAYCKVLTNVIREAKRISLNKRIPKSNNKIKTTFTIINELLGKKHYTQGIQK